MKAQISYLLFVVHYYFVQLRHLLGHAHDTLTTHYHRWTSHVTFLAVNLFFLATYDTVKEFILPFGLIGLAVVLVVSKSDW